MPKWWNFTKSDHTGHLNEEAKVTDKVSSKGVWSISTKKISIKTFVLHFGKINPWRHHGHLSVFTYKLDNDLHQINVEKDTCLMQGFKHSTILDYESHSVTTRLPLFVVMLVKLQLLNPEICSSYPSFIIVLTIVSWV